MAAAAVENPMPVTDSKSARKKKAKAEATTATNGSVSGAAVTPQAVSKDESAAAEDVSGEHAYIKELQKQIRNTTKKLSSLAKVDAILSENPGVSLDDLVAQRKINNDQRAAAQKKPQLQAQLVDLEERIEHYRKLDQDYQAKFTKQRDELASQHEQTTAKLRKELSQDAFETAQKLLRQKLLTFSQFLRCAAAKRNAEEAVDDDESRAFEGALLLVYGGDQKAVDTAMNLIDGSNETVPNIDGEPLQFTFAQVKEVSLKYTPFANEETWVDQVADATSGEAPQPPSDSAAATSDPTIVNAGLTELEASTVPNGHVEPTSAPLSGEAAGNVAGERWDADAAGTSAGAQQGSLQESYEIVPRPSEEVEIPAETPAPTQQQGTSWAEESHEAATGNQAGESWHTKAPGEQDNSWGDSAADTLAPTTDADGFSEVPGRTRGRGGFRGRGDDEFRGRGGRRGNFRGRGDGEFRGGRGGGRGRGEGGEFRGRGRGRGGPRGGAAAPAAS